MATRWINKGPVAEGTGNAHGFSANDDGVIIHHNGYVAGSINSEKSALVATTPYTVAPQMSGAVLVADAAGPLDFKLPPTKAGMRFTIVVKVVGAHKLTPVSVDKFIVPAKTDGAALTLGSGVIGDTVTVVGDGLDGWIVAGRSGTGTWT